MALIITIKCLKTIIRNKNVLNIYMIIIFFIKYMLYKKARTLDRSILIFLNVIIFLKIGCADFDVEQLRDFPPTPPPRKKFPTKSVFQK